MSTDPKQMIIVRMPRGAVRSALVALLLAASGIVVSGKQAPRFPPDSDALSEPGERRANEDQPPGQVMDLLGIRPGLFLGEVGAGRGRVTVHVAARVGEKGKVFANDIDAQGLAYLKERCRREGLANVETILGLPADARLPVNSLDMVYMTWVYHHVDQPSSF